MPGGFALTAMPPSRPAQNHTPALALWCALNIASLALAAADWPMTARNLPTHTLAVHFILAVQIIAPTLLFPLLLADAWLTLQVIATLLPFTLLARSFMPTDVPHLLAAQTYAATWITALYFVHRATQHSPLAHRLIATLAIVFALGGPVLLYLATEFGDSPSALLISHLADYTPLNATFAQLQSQTTAVAPWITIVIIAMIAAALCRFRIAHAAP